MKFSRTTVVVLKKIFRNYETVAEIGRLIFRAFQLEIELDYITVSRLLPSSKRFVKALSIGFQLIYPDCSIALCCILYMTSKHLTQVVRDYSYNSIHTCPASCSFIESCTDFL